MKVLLAYHVLGVFFELPVFLLDEVFVVDFVDLALLAEAKDECLNKLLHEDEEVIHELDFMRVVHCAMD